MASNLSSQSTRFNASDVVQSEFNEGGSFYNVLIVSFLAAWSTTRCIVIG